MKQYYNTCITFDPAVRIISGLIFWGGLISRVVLKVISRVVLFLEWSYFWGGLFLEWSFFWGGRISRLVLFLGWSYFWDGLIQGDLIFLGWS